MAKSRKQKSDPSESSGRSTRKRKAEVEPEIEEEMEDDMEADVERALNADPSEFLGPSAPKPAKRNLEDSDAVFVGDPIPRSEAAKRWPKRYKPKGEQEESNEDEEGGLEWQAKFHYSKALVDGVIYDLLDNVYVQADENQLDYIARVVEFFEGVDGEKYFTAQWFYRPEDTAIKSLGDHATMFDKRRVFLSEILNTNPLDCIVSKVKIAKVSPNLDLEAKEKSIPECELYYDMKYLIPNLTFSTIEDDQSRKESDPTIPKKDSDSTSTISSESGSCSKVDGIELSNGKCLESDASKKSEMSLLDLYSGCGAMSTGLCIGASLSNIKLMTRWAVDMNQYACESLKLNHPEAHVRNEPAENFLSLLKEWQRLCDEMIVTASVKIEDSDTETVNKDEESDDDDDGSNSAEEFEVERLLDICYGDPNKSNKVGLYFKVRWKGYDESYDTWEPLDGLSECKDKLKEFVKNGYKSKIIPLPGDVDFICGGPPCQGISGFNRFRNMQSPLEDPKNIQVQVYMDIIQFLKPRYILMENVVDLLKFSNAFLGRYAMGRLVSMNYQTRMGMMAAGSYGVPQFRMRVFLWGAHPNDKLPPYPLPTHEVANRGVVPKEFEDLLVGYHSVKTNQLDDALSLKDAFSELPAVANDENRDARPYGNEAESHFQKFISLEKHRMSGFENYTQPESRQLFDHRPLKLNQDDYERVQKIPKRKGANFRDLEGVLVNSENKVYLDPTKERPLVTSGKPLVPDYALKFVNGRSLKPFGRLWWDETISTVVTRAEPHNQTIIHPEQDRVLTIRELARLQGFPDFYQLRGPVKERYIQVGNAVAVPVGIALGYAFGQACQGLSTDETTMKLPFKFPECLLSSKKTINKEE